MSMKLVRVRAVKILEGYVVELTLPDESRKRIDLLPYMEGPIYQPLLDDYAEFMSVRVDPEAGTIVWPNGADICPDVLYHDLEPV